MKTETITRKALYELIWSEPISALIKRYQTSYPELRKTCAKMKIPIPGQGYWSRKRFGKEGAPEPLPNPYKGLQEVTLTLLEPGASSKPQSPTEQRQKEIESDNRVNLVVRENTIFLEKIIEDAKKSYNRIMKDWKNDDLRRPGWDSVIDCKVSKENIKRSLDFLDTLIKALKARGHDVIVSSRETNAIVHGQEIPISLIETSLRSYVDNGSWRSQVLTRTGKLAFRMKRKHNYLQFDDNKTSLESQLARILAELELEGERLKAEHIQWERQRKIQERKERKEQAIQDKKDREVQRFKQLLLMTYRSSVTHDLRNYIDSVENKAIKDNRMSQDLLAWIAWSRLKADWLDPTIEVVDPLLDDIDRDEFIAKKERQFEYSEFTIESRKTPWFPGKKFWQ